MDSAYADVLIIDDDPYMLEALKRCLRSYFNVQTLTDPWAALESIRAGAKYAVVVADIHMPKMSGIEFLCRLADLDPKAIRIAITGLIQIETRRAAMERAHVFHFLTKPCSTHHVIEVIEDAVEAYQRNVSTTSVSASPYPKSSVETSVPFDVAIAGDRQGAPAATSTPFETLAAPRYLSWRS